MDFYEELKNAGVPKEEAFCSIDSFLSSDENYKIKVASLNDLFDFVRISNDTLVHKAKKDLWRIVEDENGHIIIERLFDPNSNKPLKI